MTDREIWYRALCRMAVPVLDNLSREQLKTALHPEYSPTWDGRNKNVAYLECFARLMAGIAPWLAQEDCEPGERALHDRLYREALASYTYAINPDSPDYLLGTDEPQVLVEAAFLALSFMRGYDRLWLALDEQTRKHYIKMFKSVRRYTPPYNNWLLFPALVETFLMATDEEYDAYRIYLALKQMEEWYVGDGWYSDGPDFAFDYYNSYVIQPMYVECLETLAAYGHDAYKPWHERALKRMQRYACIVERLISPEGYFPTFGRSATYRTAAFQPLTMLTLGEQLPPSLPYGQVRSALTKVIENILMDDANYDKSDFLVLGFNGHQPEIADYYTNTGSLYMASLIFLPLGLPASHPFWTVPAEDWTMKRAWSGVGFPIDRKIL